MYIWHVISLLALDTFTTYNKKHNTVTRINHTNRYTTVQSTNDSARTYTKTRSDILANQPELSISCAVSVTGISLLGFAVTEVCLLQSD